MSLITVWKLKYGNILNTCKFTNQDRNVYLMSRLGAASLGPVPRRSPTEPVKHYLWTRLHIRIKDENKQIAEKQRLEVLNVLNPAPPFIDRGETETGERCRKWGWWGWGHWQWRWRRRICWWWRYLNAWRYHHQHGTWGKHDASLNYSSLLSSLLISCNNLHWLIIKIVFGWDWYEFLYSVVIPEDHWSYIVLDKCKTSNGPLILLNVVSWSWNAEIIVNKGCDMHFIIMSWKSNGYA